jgi:hypothetical protein
MDMSLADRGALEVAAAGLTCRSQPPVVFPEKQTRCDAEPASQRVTLAEQEEPGGNALGLDDGRRQKNE